VPSTAAGQIAAIVDHSMAMTNGPVALGAGGLMAFLQVDVDTDADGVADFADNCRIISNGPLTPGIKPNQIQRDSNSDGYGNICDGDLNNDLFVNFADLAILKTLFFKPVASFPGASEGDLNGDGFVNFADLAILKTLFFKALDSGLVP